VEVVIGIGEYKVIKNENDSIKTFALGSCVALTAYCPNKKVLGMVHIALPDSTIDKVHATKCPGYFADTAIPMIIGEMCSIYGCRENDLIINIFGGANSINKNDIFQIGRRNIEAVKDIIESRRMSCNFKDTGGTFSRTVEIYVATGEAKLEIFPLKI
jgi:chemotaxis protein CheD